MNDRRDRSRPYRLVPVDEPTPLPQPVPNLKRGPLAELLAGLPQWQRTAITIVLASGISLGGVAKFVGVETSAAATERETRLMTRILALEGSVTDLRQAMRKEGLSEQAQIDVGKVVAGALARAGLAKAGGKKKPAPAPSPAAAVPPVATTPAEAKGEL